MEKVNFFWVAQRNVCGDPFLGVQFRYLAVMVNDRGECIGHRVQVRLGFIWWESGISFCVRSHR